MIVIDAVYINNSGGKILLEYFVEHMIRFEQLEVYYLIDNRLSSSVIDKISNKFCFRLEASENKRKQIYKSLPLSVKTIFCFANVPPPIKIYNSKVVILFHNTLLLSSKKIALPLLVKAKNLLKRLYLKMTNLPNYEWVVQTEVTKSLLMKSLSIETQQIKVLPFFDVHFFEVDELVTKNKWAFLYVAEGIASKNHSTLLDAWRLLHFNYKCKPLLNLTVSGDYPVLLAKIQALKEIGVNIINHGACSKNKIKELYAQNAFLIYPSLTESFGLPLVEAATAGCEVIASDLPYVHCIVKPYDVFNPYSSKELAQKIASLLEVREISKTTNLLIKNEINNIIKLIIT